MLEFWFKGKWRDYDGWEITLKLSVHSTNRKDAEETADANFHWYTQYLPGAPDFLGKDLIKVEET